MPPKGKKTCWRMRVRQATGTPKPGPGHRVSAGRGTTAAGRKDDINICYYYS